MAYAYKIFKDMNFCFVKASGSINSLDIVESVEKMFNDKDWIFGLDMINDYRDILELVVTKEDIDKIVELEEEHEKSAKKPFRRGKLAFVVNNDIYELIVRLYSAKSKNVKKDISIFHSIDEAIEWIGLKTVPPEILTR